MKRKLLAALLGTSLLVGCGDNKPAVSMADLPKENAISFSVNAQKMVITDKIRVNLNIKKTGSDTTTLTQQVNAATAEVFKLIQASKAVEGKTTSFYTGRNYNYNGSYYSKAPEWEVTQGIYLESTDAKALSSLVASFQDKVQVGSVSYDLSDQAIKDIKQELTQTALNDFREHAKAIAKDMGFSRYRIINMNIKTWDDNYYAYDMASVNYYSAYNSGENKNGEHDYNPSMVAADSKAGLVLEGGKNLYRVTVSGQVVVPSK